MNLNFSQMPLADSPNTPTHSLIHSLVDLTFPGREIVVPQYDYKPRNRGFICKYPYVSFNYRNMGMIPLRVALDEEYEGLEKREELMFKECKSKISLRILLKGYQPWELQIRIKDGRMPPTPITLARLSTEVAKAMNKFIEDNEDKEIDPEYSDWKVGREALTLDCFQLKYLIHVNKASFQPIFVLNLDKSYPYFLAERLARCS